MFKFKKLLAVVVSACCIVAALPSAFVMADGSKVVTLGADLSDDQKTMILKYFGIEGETVDTLTITNQDERDHLGAYVPLEQIGTRTFSCALVNPTTSGGIQVKTANLTWVTSNMIAATLSTSGVVNCDVVAAAPFPVSGTGALTGVIMAYESASGETLDPEKTDAANQELVTTATIGDHIGAPEATLVVNEAKEQVIEGNVVDTGDITNIVNNVTEENNITLDQDDEDMLVDLLEQISQLQYDIDDMKTTLDRVEDNVNAEMNGTTPESSDQPDEDSILNDTDPDAFADSGEDVPVEDSTAPEESEASTDETEAPATEAATEAPTEDDSGLQIFTSDTYNGNEDGAAEPETTAPAPEAEPETQAPTEAETEAPAPLEAPEPETPAPETEAPAAEPETEAPAEEPDTEAPEVEPQGDLQGMISQTAPVSDGSEDTAEAADTEAPETEAAVATLTVDDITFVPDSTVEPGLNMVEILSAHPDLTAGSGTITIFNADDGSEVESISLNDGSQVVSYEITDSDTLAELGADDGIEFDIYLSSPLAAGTDYTVSVSDDAFELEGAMMQGADNVWSFSTASSGISIESSMSGAEAGTEMTGNVYLDSSVEGYAVIDSVTIDDADVTEDAGLSQTDFTESGSFQLTFPNSGTAKVHVTFYDSSDSMNYVDEASATIVVD